MSNQESSLPGGARHSRREFPISFWSIFFAATFLGGCSDPDQVTIETSSSTHTEIRDLQDRLAEGERELEQAKANNQALNENVSLLKEKLEDAHNENRILAETNETQNEQITQLLKFLEIYETQLSVTHINNPGLEGQIRTLHNRVREARYYLDAEFPGRYKPYIPPQHR